MDDHSIESTGHHFSHNHGAYDKPARTCGRDMKGWRNHDQVAASRVEMKMVRADLVNTAMSQTQPPAHVWLMGALRIRSRGVS